MCGAGPGKSHAFDDVCRTTAVGDHPEPPWQDWLRLSRGDYGYEITGWATPADHDRSAGTSLEITLFDGRNRRPDNIGAEEFAAVVHRLAADFPQSRSDWVIINSFIYANDPPSIRSDHGLPTSAQLRLWQALDAIAPILAPSIWTRSPTIPNNPTAIASGSASLPRETWIALRSSNFN